MGRNRLSITYLTIEEAERLTGKRLDRRRRYFLSDAWHDGKMQVCYLGWYTTSCSGCFEGGEYGGLAHNYPYDEKAGCRVGAGCEECGHTGKRRYPIDIPHDAPMTED